MGKRCIGAATRRAGSRPAQAVTAPGAKAMARTRHSRGHPPPISKRSLRHGAPASATMIRWARCAISAAGFRAPRCARFRLMLRGWGRIVLQIGEHSPQYIVAIPEMMLQRRPDMDRDHCHQQNDQHRMDALGPVEDPPLEMRRQCFERHVRPGDDAPRPAVPRPSPSTTSPIR
jgi:hypothetical protein